MDQLKKQLAGVLQYGFWIGCVVVLVGSLAVWFLSTGDLNAQNESQERKITSEVSKVSQLRGELDSQPNEDSHTKMQEMIDKRKKEVINAWRLVYNKQTKILTWPVDITEAYVDEFRYVRDPETQQIDKKKLKLPFELYVDHGPDGYQAQSRILRGYAKYIGIELPKLAEIAKAEWTADFEAKSGSDGGMDEMNMGRPKMEIDVTGLTQGPLVRWSSASQEALMTDLFPWRGTKPSTLQVYYSQESLWILRQMLQIIAEINGDAIQPFEANIHEIVQLSIGKSVRFGAGNIASPGVESAGGREGYSDMMEASMSGEMDGYGQHGRLQFGIRSR